MNFHIDEATLAAGEEYTVDFKAKDFAKLVGYQFTLNLSDAVNFVDVQAGELSGLTNANFGLSLLDEGVITANWASTNAVSMADDAVIFSLTVKAKSAT